MTKIETLNEQLEKRWPKDKRQRKCKFDPKTKSVNPCWCLTAAIECVSFEKRKGIMQYQLISTKTGKISQSLIGVRSGFFKDGIMFNYCPFCGTEINKH